MTADQLIDCMMFSVCVHVPVSVTVTRVCFGDQSCSRPKSTVVHRPRPGHIESASEYEQNSVCLAAEGDYVRISLSLCL